MNIILYVKPSCTWANDIQTTLERFQLPFRIIDIDTPESQTLFQQHQQPKPEAPCLQIDSGWLSNTSAEEVEKYLIANQLVKMPQKPSSSVQTQDFLHRRIARANTQRFF